jgi:ribonuclease G
VGKQILINSSPWEVRVALLEDTTRSELHLERPAERGIAGNVYKGRVTRVLPGMQAAFVDIGLPKAAFLHVSDLSASHALPPEVAREDDVDPDDLAESPGPPPNGGPIEARLHKGDELLVQIAKEPIGTKGARITTHV